MRATTGRRMRRLGTTAVMACSLALTAATAAHAQSPVPPTGVGPADTVIGSLSGGITAHDYNCDEHNPKVQAIIQGVRDSLTNSFPDITTMIARGYSPYADAPLFGMSGRQGHWLNPGYMEDGHIMDPARPEGILVDRWNRPIGVMFIEDQPETPGPDIYTNPDGSPCNAWHYHSEITADAYWYAYKYGWSNDVQEGDIEPEDRSPDLMHVWRYGDYKYQWQHAAPPADQMPGDPSSAQDVKDSIGGPRPPGPGIPPPAR